MTTHYRSLARALLGMTALSFPAILHAATQPVLPDSGAYTSGSGAIAQSGSTMTISQSSKNGVIQWNGFSVGQGGTVQFNNGSGATLNRVVGGDISVIAGKVGSTGSVFLINPNGVIVSPTGQVATDGSFIASSRSTTDAQFMAGGSITLSGSSSGVVSNAGSITSKSGNVALIGSAASNSGTISAANGVTAMIAGDNVIMKSDGSGVYVSQKSVTSGDVTNSGQIKAAAARLEASNGNVYALAGNSDGIIQATGVATVNGEVTLVADNGAVDVAGSVNAQSADGGGGSILINGSDSVAIESTASISASGVKSSAATTAATTAATKNNGGTILIGASSKGANNLTKALVIKDGANIHADGSGGGNGGYIETSGQGVSIGDASISASWSQDASGLYGNSGSWVTDPYDLTIDQSAANSITSALTGGTDVTLSTDGSSYYGGTVASGSGDININGNIVPPDSGVITSGLTINASRNININGEVEFIRHYLPACEDGSCFYNTFSNVNLNYGGSLNFGSGGEVVFRNYVHGGAITEVTSDVINLFLNGESYSQNNMALSYGKIGVFRWSNYTLSASNYVAPVIPISITINNQSYVYGQGGYQSGQYVVTNSSGNVIVDPNLVVSIVGAGTGATRTTNVGSYALTYGGISGDSSKYAVTGATGGTLYVTQKALSITAENQSLVYGNSSTLDASKYSVSGLINGDTVSSVALGTVAGSAPDVGSYSISASNAQGVGLGNYAISYTGGTLSITPATLTVTAGNQSSVYGGSPSINQSDYSISGAKYGDAFSGVTLASSVSKSSDAGSYGITASGISGSKLGNYSVNYVNGNYAITPASLSIALGNQSSVYGSDVMLNSGDFTVSGLKNGDAISSVDLLSSASKTSDVGSYAITAHGVNGINASNYNISYTNGSMNITPADLTITAGNQSSVYGDAINLGSTSFSTSGLKNSDAVSSVDLASSASGQSDIGSYSINASAAQGLGLSNYNITYASGSLQITPAMLTISAGNQSSVYGASPDISQRAYTVSGIKNASDNVSGVTLSAGVDKTSHVGSYAISASDAVGSGLGNYDIVYNNGAYAITPASLTITANDQSFVYGDAVDLGSKDFSASGLVNNDKIDSVSLYTPATSLTGVGSYGITASNAIGANTSDYNITYVNGLASITPASLTISASDQTAVYGQNHLFGNSAFSVVGLKNNDSVTSASLVSDATSASAVGNYTISASDAQGVGLSNYDISYVNGSMAITPASLTITALDQNSVYGNDVDLGNTKFISSGLVNNDAVTAIDLKTEATGQSGIGQYAISASDAHGSGLSNYTINYAEGKLDITPASLTVSAAGQSSIYGDTVNLGNTDFTVSGLKNSDTVRSVSLTSSATDTSSVGSYSISASNAQGSGLENYNITYKGNDIDITPAALTVSANNATSVYGDDVSALHYSVSGLKNNDSVLSANISSKATSASNAGNYIISASGAQGSGLSNYNISYVNGNYAITPASLTISTSNQSSIYGNDVNLGDTAFTTSGLKNGDVVTSVDLNTAATGQSDIGSYVISASGAQGINSGNYNISYVSNGHLSITPASLVITSSGQSSVYGSSFDLGDSAFTVSGLKNSDSVDTATLSTDATSTSATGSYAITVSNAQGGGLSNYTVTYNNASPGYLTIYAPSPKPNAYIDSAVLAGSADQMASSAIAQGSPVAVASITSNAAGSSDQSSSDTGNSSKSDQAKKILASENCSVVSASDCNLNVDSAGNVSAIVTGVQNGIIVTPSQSVVNSIQ